MLKNLCSMFFLQIIIFISFPKKCLVAVHVNIFFYKFIAGTLQIARGQRLKVVKIIIGHSVLIY